MDVPKVSCNPRQTGLVCLLTQRNLPISDDHPPSLVPPFVSWDHTPRPRNPERVHGAAPLGRSRK